MEAEAVGMVLLALSTILGAFAIVAKPMLQLNATITRLESVLESLQEKMAEAGRIMRDQDARLDRAETTLTEHGLRIERLEEECERRHGRWGRRTEEGARPSGTATWSRGSKRSGSGPRQAPRTKR